MRIYQREGHRSQPKELQMVKLIQFEVAIEYNLKYNEIILDFNSKYKINIHELILIQTND